MGKTSPKNEDDEERDPLADTMGLGDTIQFERMDSITDGPSEMQNTLKQTAGAEDIAIPEEGSKEDGLTRDDNEES